MLRRCGEHRCSVARFGDESLVDRGALGRTSEHLGVGEAMRSADGRSNSVEHDGRQTVFCFRGPVSYALEAVAPS